MSEKTLVIVESPTKAKTIGKFLGKDYIVKASMGHIRDLPSSAEEIPLELKKQPWARLGINIEDNFEPLYIIPDDKKKNVKILKDAIKESSLILLATDEDREGESISWHILEALKPKIPTKRLVFHEITKEAIEKALNSTREIDENLVKAQETRRIVDRLFGYEVSPLLWKKMARGLSAGRVQSVVVKLLVEREKERAKFKKAIYWGIKATFLKGAANFDAELFQLGKDRIAIGKDFDPNTGKLKSDQGIVALDQEKVNNLVAKIKDQKGIVTEIEEKPFSSNPPAPFVTSTLQQEANSKFRFAAKHTMRVAQQLYENGFITYMRTDSTTLSGEALNAARTLIERDYGKDYLPKEARIYTTKVKNAQEAHEAIRPAGEQFTPLKTVELQLPGDAAKLYELIWKRTVASQMTNSVGRNTSVQIAIGDALFKATGKIIDFPGYLRAYVEGSDDPDAELADKDKILPPLVKNDSLEVSSLQPAEHSTLPPSRYSEGSLIKELERLGIGRPSTWATVVDLVLSRSYANKRGNALVPTFTAIAVAQLLETHFTNLLDYNFTARLEDDLDAISRGEAITLNYLKEFYYGNGHPGLHTLVKKGEEEIDPRVVCGLAVGKSSTGLDIEVRIGRYGPFITDGTNRSSLPDTIAYDELTVQMAEEILVTASKQPDSLGTHPETNLAIYLKTGRFGPYVQMGEISEDGKTKPKMSSLLKGMKPEDVTFETAVRLLSLPKILGKYPENNEDIIASNGRFGPYIKCGTDTRSIPAEISLLDFTLEQAIELLKQPKTKGRGSKPATLKDLGINAENEKAVSIKSGRYGPYVTDGETNVSLTKDILPENLTLEQAVIMLKNKADSGPTKKPKRGAKSTGGAKKKKAKTKESTEETESE